MRNDERGMIHLGLAVLASDAAEWEDADLEAVILEADGRFTFPGTFGTDRGSARATDDGVLVVFDEDPDEPDLVQSVLVGEDGNGGPYLMHDVLSPDELRAERAR